MAIESWLPALLGYLIPLGLFLLAWGGMNPKQARRSTTVGTLALSLAALGYLAIGFAFHLGGAQVISERAGLDLGVDGLNALYGTGDNRAWGLVGLSGFFLSSEDKGQIMPLSQQSLALFVNYLPMVATAVLLVVLSVHGRARGWQTALAGLVIAAVLFPLVACWAWGGGWLSNLGSPETLERGHGFVDHAGSGVVYLLGGLAALGALIGLGQRLPRDHREAGEPAEMPPAHFPLLANLGTLLFGLGLVGWSLSAPFHTAGADLNLPRTVVNIWLAGAGAIFFSQTYSWFAVGHADALMSARGAAAGFIAIAAAAPFVPPWAALVTGAVAGLLLPLGVYLVEHVLRLPDTTATVALGITAGLVGLLVVAVFADGLSGQGWNGVGLGEYRIEVDKGVTGFLPAERFDNGDGPGQLVAQLAGTGAIGVFSFLVGWLTFLVLNLPYARPWTRRQLDETQQNNGPES